MLGSPAGLGHRWYSPRRVRVYKRISVFFVCVTAEIKWFFFTMKLFIGPGKVYNYAAQKNI